MIDVNYITVDDLRENTSISNSVDEKLLVPYIRSTEKMRIEKILGVALDTQLKSMITGNTLTGDYFNLVKYYIKPYSCFATWLQSIPYVAFKTKNAGVVRQSSANSEVPTTDDLSWFRKFVKDEESFYRQELIDYLENNQSLFPSYRSNQPPSSSRGYSNGIFLGGGH